MKFTVIGFYREDNQTTADPVQAESGEEALKEVARQRLGAYDRDENTYENQGEFELVCAVLQGPLDNEDANPGDRFTWPGDGTVEAREYIEPGWELLPTEADNG